MLDTPEPEPEDDLQQELSDYREFRAHLDRHEANRKTLFDKAGILPEHRFLWHEQGTGWRDFLCGIYDRSRWEISELLNSYDFERTWLEQEERLHPYFEGDYSEWRNSPRYRRRLAKRGL